MHIVVCVDQDVWRRRRSRIQGQVNTYLPTGVIADFVAIPHWGRPEVRIQGAPGEVEELATRMEPLTQQSEGYIIVPIPIGGE